MRIFRKIGTAFVVTMLLSACGKGVAGGDKVTLNMVNQLTTTLASLQQYERVQAFGEQFSPASLLKQLGLAQGQSYAPMTTNAVGQNSISQLKSFKYRFMSIQVCKSLTASGTGYSNTSGCLSLYDEGAGEDYDTFGRDKGLADTTNYLDLMDKPAVKAKLSQGAVVAADTEFNFGVINWYRPVKMTAEVDLNDSTHLVTKSGGTVTSTGSGINTVSKITVDTLVGASGSAEEVVAELSNGGAWFKFQSPFKATKGEAYTVDLAFNPERMVTGTSSASNLVLTDTAGRAIDVPMLAVTPVVHASNDTAMKEVYTLVDAGTTQYQLRIELYYVKSDTAKTVYGASIRTILTSTSTANFMDPGQVFSMKTNTDGTIDLQNYLGTSMVGSLKRGQNGTATFDTSSGGLFSDLALSPATRTMTVTYGTDVEVK